MEFTFKVGESIKKAWVLYKENLGNILLFMFTAFVLNMIVSGVIFAMGVNPPVLMTVIINIISFMVGLFIMFIWIKSNLEMLDGKGFNPFRAESFSSWDRFWNFVKTNILVSVCVIAPAFLVSSLSVILLKTVGKSATFALIIILIGAILYFAIRVFPAYYLTVDKNYGALKSLNEAWSMTKDNFWVIFWKTILVLLFVILGILAFFVGLIITYPVGMIVIVMLYRSLLGKKSSVEFVAVPEVVVTEEVIVEKVEEVK